MKLTITIETRDEAFNDSPLMNKLGKKDAIRRSLQALVNCYNANRTPYNETLYLHTKVTHILEE